MIILHMRIGNSSNLYACMAIYSSVATALNVSQSFHIYPSFVYASHTGSGEHVHFCSFVLVFSLLPKYHAIMKINFGWK